MPMTVLVTRDVEDRYRGFLASAMLEIAPGVYTAPELSAAVRERVWTVVSGWHATLGRGSIVMTWRDPAAPGGQGIRSLGTPPYRLVDAGGVMLAKVADQETSAPE
jgi:CRISPR-associated protein Cas2